MKIHPLQIGFPLLAALGFALGAAAAESPSILLQRGIYAEETEGNLEAAIKIYEQIAAAPDSDRPVAAQARYRLAVGFEKKGSREQAISVLQELLRQFPSETALASQAQKRLADLGHAPAEVMMTRNIPLASPGEVVAVSPDGHYVATWSGSLNVLVSEAATGKTWVLVKGTRENHICGDLVFSPDSTQIAYDIAGKTIKVSRSDGSESKDIYDTKERTEAELNVVGWLPDATRLIVVRRFSSNSPKPSILGEVDVQSGTWKEIMNISAGEYLLSKDGRYVAVRKGNRELSGTVSLLDLETHRETSLEGEVSQLAGWSPWEPKLLFTSARTGASGLWSVTMDGVPTLVSINWADRIVRAIGQDGRIYYSEAKGASDVYVVLVNFDSGDNMRDPRRVMERNPGAQSLPVWSKNGRFLMLAVQGEQKGFSAVTIPGSERRDYPLSGFTIGRVAWSEAGGFMLLQGFGPGMQPGIQRYDLASGKLETLVGTSESNGSIWQPELSLDESSFYFIRRVFPKNRLTGNPEPKDRIVRRDLRSTKEEVVFVPAERLNIWGQMKLSPDGRQLAVVTQGRGDPDTATNAISVVTLEGGNSKEVAALDPGSNRVSMAWTHDGKRIVYAQRGKIWSVAVNSGETVSLKIPKYVLGDIAIAMHPEDTRQIVFAARSEGGGELWVMEGALTQPKVVSAPTP